jgi:hypothetical protein
MLVAAYLYCVATLFRCKALDQHIDIVSKCKKRIQEGKKHRFVDNDQVLQEREKKGQLCTVVKLQKSPVPTLFIPAINEYRYLLD